MATAAYTSPGPRRQTFGVSLNTNMHDYPLESPSPPLSESPSTPTDSSCGCAPDALVMGSDSESTSGPFYTTPSTHTMSPRGPRPPLPPIPGRSSKPVEGFKPKRTSRPIPPLPVVTAQAVEGLPSPESDSEIGHTPLSAIGDNYLLSKRPTRQSDPQLRLHGMQPLTTAEPYLHARPSLDEQRPTDPLLTPLTADYRLSPLLAPVRPDPIRGPLPNPEEEHFLPSSVGPSSSQLLSPVSDSESNADVEMLGDLLPPNRSRNVLAGSTPWNDADFMSPLERIGAVKLASKGKLSNKYSSLSDLPTATDGKRLSRRQERLNLAVLLPEAGPTLVSTTTTPVEGSGLEFSGSPSPSMPNRIDTALRLSTGSASDAAGPSRSNYVDIDDVELSPIESLNDSGYTRLSQDQVQRNQTLQRAHRTGNSNIVEINNLERRDSQSASASNMKSLPATPVDSSLASVHKPSVASTSSIRGPNGQKLRWTKSLANVFRKAEADRHAHEMGSMNGDDVPPLPHKHMESPTDDDAQVKSTLFPGELAEEDETFSVSRLPSRNRLFEAGTCFVRDDEGRAVCVSDFFPKWPETEDGEPQAPKNGHTPRTILFFLRNFWCGMCQDYTMTSISRLDPVVLAEHNIRVVVIGCGDWRMIKPYCKLFNLNFPCYTDGPRRLYELMGMVKGAAWKQPRKNRPAYNRPYFTQVFSGVKNGLQHMPLSDPGYWRQLGGEFILAPDFKCEFAHRMTNMANHMEATDVLAIAGVDPVLTNRLSLLEPQESTVDVTAADQKAMYEAERAALERMQKKNEFRKAYWASRSALHSGASSDGGSSIPERGSSNKSVASLNSTEQTHSELFYTPSHERSFSRVSNAPSDVTRSERFATPVGQLSQRSSSRVSHNQSVHTRSDQFISPPPDLIPPGSESSSEGPAEVAAVEEMDPIELHRKYYSALTLDSPDSARPVVFPDYKGKGKAPMRGPMI